MNGLLETETAANANATHRRQRRWPIDDNGTWYASSGKNRGRNSCVQMYQATNEDIMSTTAAITNPRFPSHGSSRCFGKHQLRELNRYTTIQMLS